MNNEIQQGQVIIDNLLIHYYYSDLKTPQKTVLFLHGWGPNSSSWFGIFPAFLKDNIQIFALDFPGFGKSQKPHGALTLQNYVDLTLSFMEKLSIRKPIVVGHSHGGRVAIKLATENPAAIGDLVLVDSAGIKNTSTSIALKKSIAKIAKPFFKPSFMQPLRSKIYKSMGADDYLATPEFMDTFRNIIEEDLAPILSSIQNRTLLIWGENDKDTPLNDAKVMKEKIPHSKLEVIKDAGHYSFLDQKEKFIEILQTFLKE